MGPEQVGRHVNGLADRSAEGMTMAEIDAHIVDLVGEVRAARATQDELLRRIEAVDEAVRRFDDGIRTFYAEEQGWPRVVRVEERLGDLEQRIEAIEAAHPRQGIQVPRVVRDNALPASLGAGLVAGLYGLTQLLSWVGAMVAGG